MSNEAEWQAKAAETVKPGDQPIRLIPAVEELRLYLTGTRKMEQARPDRYNWSGEPKWRSDPYLEIGTSYGELRLRYYVDGKMVDSFNCTMEKHINQAKRWIRRTVVKPA